MSGSTNIRLFATAALALVVLVGSKAFSQAPPPGSQETVLTFVHDFLQVFYPEALGKGNQLILCVSHPADASWREISGVYFKVTPSSTEEPNPLTDPNPTPNHLGGFFWLRPQQLGRIQQFAASFDAVHAKDLKAVRDLVESHPEWAETAAIRALKQAGARYGPAEKEEFVNSLHLEKAERFLGRLKLKSVEFNGLSPIHTGNFAAGSLDWVVQAEAELPDGTHVDYGFTFEPFGGKLIFVSRR